MGEKKKRLTKKLKRKKVQGAVHSNALLKSILPKLLRKLAIKGYRRIRRWGGRGLLRIRELRRQNYPIYRELKRRIRRRLAWFGGMSDKLSDVKRWRQDYLEAAVAERQVSPIDRTVNGAHQRYVQLIGTLIQKAYIKGAFKWLHKNKISQRGGGRVGLGSEGIKEYVKGKVKIGRLCVVRVARTIKKRKRLKGKKLKRVRNRKRSKLVMHIIANILLTEIKTFISKKEVELGGSIRLWEVWGCYNRYRSDRFQEGEIRQNRSSKSDRGFERSWQPSVGVVDFNCWKGKLNKYGLTRTLVREGQLARLKEHKLLFNDASLRLAGFGRSWHYRLLLLLRRGIPKTIYKLKRNMRDKVSKTPRAVIFIIEGRRISGKQLERIKDEILCQNRILDEVYQPLLLPIPTDQVPMINKGLTENILSELTRGVINDKSFCGGNFTNHQLTIKKVVEGLQHDINGERPRKIFRRGIWRFFRFKRRRRFISFSRTDSIGPIFTKLNWTAIALRRLKTVLYANTRHYYDLWKLGAAWKFVKPIKERVNKTFTVETFMKYYELNLGMLVYRSGFVPARKLAEWLVEEDCVCVNGRMVNSVKHQINNFDVISFTQGMRLKLKLAFLKNLHISLHGSNVGWGLTTLKFAEFNYKIFGFTYLAQLFRLRAIPMRDLRLSERVRRRLVYWGKHEFSRYKLNRLRW